MKQVNNSKFIFIAALVGLLFTIAGVGIYRQATSHQRLVEATSSVPNAAAKVDGINVSDQEIIGNESLAFYRLEEAVYLFKIEKLQALIRERALAKAAKSSGESAAQLLEKKIGKAPVSEQEINAFAEQSKLPAMQKNNPQIRDRIREYLSVQKTKKRTDALVARTFGGKDVEYYFHRPKFPKLKKLPRPTLGMADAKVQFVEFSDLSSPASRAAWQLIEKKFKAGSMRLDFHFFPASGNASAAMAAEAALCAGDQGPAFFTEFRKQLDSLSALDIGSARAGVKKTGANLKDWDACMAAHKFAQQLAQDVDYANSLGVHAGPEIFMNDRPLLAPLSEGDLDNALEAASHE